MAKDTRTDLKVLLPGISTIFITGATSGIGEALAKVFLKNGFTVIAIGRNVQKLDELQSQGALIKVLDLGSSRDIQEAGKLVDYYKPDLFYHAAGYTHYGNLHERNLGELLEELKLHMESLVVLLHHFGNLPDKKRLFMGFSSALAYVPAAGMSLYSSCKKAIQTLCQLSDIELRNKGFRVLSCQPGPVVTAFHTRASVGYYQERSPLSLTTEEALCQILWQTQKGISSLPIGPMAWAAWFIGKCLPFRLVAKTLHRQTLSRVKKN